MVRQGQHASGERGSRHRRSERLFVLKRASAAAFLLMLIAWSGSARAASPPKVVATFNVVGDLVRQVAGDDVALTVLIGGGVDPHLFDPVPSDARHLARADLVLEHGLGLEGWLDRLYRASGSKARRVVVTEGIELRRVGTACCAHHATNLPVDPHTWHNVANVRVMLQHVTDAIVTLLPEREASLRQRAEAYDAQLLALDEWIRNEVARVHDRSRRLVTAHDSLGYFADTYGFEVIGIVIPSMSTDAADRSPAELAALIRHVRETGVAVIFADASHSARLAHTVARESGAGRVALLYTDGLGTTPETSTYLGMMRTNVSTIVEALLPVMALQEQTR